MVIKEFLKTRGDGVNLYKSYSDQNLMIRKVGTNEIYASAVDIEDAPYGYVETDAPIPVREPSTYIPKRKAKAEESVPDTATV